MKGYLGAILFMLFGHMSFSQTTEQSDKNLTENFRASIVKIDITPDSSQYLHGYGTRKSVGVNGWLGYLLTEEEYKYRGYEPTVSPFTPGAASDLTETVVSYLQGKIL